MLENDKVQEGLDNLETYMNTSQWEQGNESGFKVGFDGLTTPIPGDLHSTNLGNISNNSGAYHTHTPKGLHMFMVGDHLRLLDFAFVQQPSTNVGNAFLGMYVKESSSCTSGYKYIHYVIRYTGTYNDLVNFPLPLNDIKIAELDDLQKSRYNVFKSLYKDSDGNITPAGLEFLFFEAVKDLNINLENKIVLQRVDSNTNAITNLTYNNGRINESVCP